MSEDAVAEIEEREPTLWWIALYLVDRAWGGSEEGGWWFDTGELVTDGAIYDDVGAWPQAVTSLDLARAHAQAMQMRADSTVNVGRRDIGSVLSTGRYSAEIMPTYPPLRYPALRPTYE